MQNLSVAFSNAAWLDEEKVALGADRETGFPAYLDLEVLSTKERESKVRGIIIDLLDVEFHPVLPLTSSNLGVVIFLWFPHINVI